MFHKPLKYGINKKDIKKIADQHLELTIHKIEDLFQQILIEVYTLVLIDLKRWIARFVPKRTGQLRDNLFKNILSSRVKSNYIIIIIRTNIDYAKRVNAMTTAQVRHKGRRREHHVAYITKGRGKAKIGKGKRYYPYAYAYYWGKHGRIILNDPEAIGGFFDMMIIFAIKSILINLKKVKHRYAARTKLKYKDMRIIKLW